MSFVRFYSSGNIRNKHAEKMNNFILMFGKPKDETRRSGRTLPHGVVLTPHGTYKTEVKRVYLGTFKELDQAVNAVTEFLNPTT